MSNSDRTPAGPLSDLRVLELADEKAQFCGKMMADLGADVIKIEPAGGQHTRRVGPFLDDEPHLERSLYFWHYNTSKRGITLDLDSEAGAELFKRLAATVDIVLESYAPGYLPSLGLGYDDLSADNPALVMCSVTPFGQTGPWRDYRTSDLLHMAAGGQMASCGYDEEDVPNPPPIAPGGGNAWHMGSHFAYMAIMAALHYRHVSGEGQWIDASIHEACALTTEGAIPVYIYTDAVVRRHTGRHASVGASAPNQIPSTDGGWVQTTGSGGNPTPRRLRGLAEWMDTYGLAGDLLDDKYLYLSTFRESTAHINEVIGNFIANMPREEAWRGGQEHGYPWGAVRTLDEIVDDPHLKDRAFFVEVEHPELDRSYKYPGTAAIYNGSPWNISRRAPLIGEHNVEVYCDELGLSRRELTVLAENGVV
ncbi:MAG: CoA transferase [SAR202 cluster bacterium]|nr:CoA transferase [SAR202 cluster bacterium]MDP6300851.1 CoA transferase [SAR202 cluster bacterium]MDP7104622.1 CoA transferase [SAR202 cluster bacterium]MDP7226263.1 CoA transferase [SAR202 cluster bacterium]MDP7415130.1 CoA transferase [SAR202 cluster bacterium]